MNFEEILYHRIGDACQAGDGAHASIKRVEAGVPYLMARNIKDGKLDLAKISYISEADFEKHFKVTSRSVSRVRKNDVVFGIIGSIGDAYIVKKHDRFGLSSSVAILRPDTSQLNPKYLYYWVLGEPFQTALYNIKGGVAQGYVSLEMVKSLPLSIPNLGDQDRIASILSTYEDLIENNTRRIEILEEMAWRLYEEWFVHFRFPGHEEVSFKEGELGEIPDGWEVVTVGDLVNIKRGKTITKKKIEPGNVPVVAGGLRPAYYHSTANTKAPLLTISASGANAGHVSLYYDDVWASDCSFIDSSESQHVYYYYLMLKVRQEEVTHLQRGSAQPHVYPKDVMGLQAVNAPLSLRESFMNYVGPMFRAIDTLLKKNVNLRAQRDLLLPKLVSGEIDVSDIPMPDDKEVEAA